MPPRIPNHAHPDPQQSLPIHPTTPSEHIRRHAGVHLLLAQNPPINHNPIRILMTVMDRKDNNPMRSPFRHKGQRTFHALPAMSFLYLYDLPVGAHKDDEELCVGVE